MSGGDIASTLGTNPPIPPTDVVGISALAVGAESPDTPGNLVDTIYLTLASPAATALTAAIGPNIGPAPVGGGANAAAAAL